MPAPINSFKQSLGKGKSLLGCWIGMVDPSAAEISASAGFDWLLVDGEHAPNDIRSMVPQLQVIEKSGSHPMVRVPHGEAWIIKQVLDIGAQTILVPMVESADQAEQLVKATQYPPKGIRGVGASLARASRYSGIPDYTTTADKEICLLVQVENRAGVEALDDILKVDGVHGVFIGPADLAADLGHLGDAGNLTVQSIIDESIRKIKAASKAAGILAMNEDSIQKYLSMNIDFMGIGIDVTVFANAMRNLANKYSS